MSSERISTNGTPSVQTNVTARMVAERLGCGISTVYLMWDQGTIRSVRIGRKLRRTSWLWVEEFLTAHPGSVQRERMG